MMDELTAKQATFVREYLVDLNGKQAAIRAGYSPKTAEAQASRLLTYAKVSKAVAAAQAERAKRTEIDADRVIAELAKIGFSDIRKVAKWASNVAVAAPDERTVDEILESGELRTAVVNIVELIDSESIDDETAAAISEISMSDKGTLKVKLHDKRAALVDLARHLGLFKDGPQINVNVAPSLAHFYGQAIEPDG